MIGIATTFVCGSSINVVIFKLCTSRKAKFEKGYDGIPVTKPKALA